MRVGIIGGGLMGMALASRYAADGHEVTIVEYADQAGGLATWSDFGGFNWDRFHHVILPSDQQLIGFLRDLGMDCLLYTSPSPRDGLLSRMPSSA